MDTSTLWPWLGLLLLGALHGINPGMGWLFAVSLGLQEGDARAVWRALGPLALGHLLAIAVVLALAAAVGLVIPPDVLRWGIAVALCGMGAFQLVRHLHPRVGGMRVGARELTLWSFLMASAHGAGVMALPLALAVRGAGSPDVAARDGVRAAVDSAVSHAHGAASIGANANIHGDLLLAAVPTPELAGLFATLVHTAGYLAVTAVVAVLVYERLGLGLLRKAWINLDLIWAVALLLTGVLTVAL
jgi:hypothetical protein